MNKNELVEACAAARAAATEAFPTAPYMQDQIFAALLPVTVVAKALSRVADALEDVTRDPTRRVLEDAARDPALHGPVSCDKSGGVSDADEKQALNDLFGLIKCFGVTVVFDDTLGQYRPRPIAEPIECRGDLATISDPNFVRCVKKTSERLNAPRQQKCDSAASSHEGSQ